MSYSEVIKNQKKFKLGKLAYKEKSYDLFVNPSPNAIYEDDLLTWEAKGFLGHLWHMGTPKTIHHLIIVNLINAGYLVEVQE